MIFLHFPGPHNFLSNKLDIENPKEMVKLKVSCNVVPGVGAVRSAASEVSDIRPETIGQQSGPSQALGITGSC